MPAVDHDFSNALFHHRAGDLARAEKLYRRVLSKRPRHAGALHMLGVLASEAGRQQEAAALIASAIRVSGPTPQYCLNLALALTRQGRWDQAGVCYRQAIDLDPSATAGTWYNLGVTQMAQGRFDDAIAAYRRALQLDANHAEAHHNLGTVFQATSRAEEAAACYERAARARPDFADPHYNLAMLRQEQDRLEEAEQGYRHVLALHPSHAEAHNNLGNTLLAQGRAGEALECYHSAAARDPGHAQARWNIGLVRLLLGDFRQGWKGYEWRLQQRESVPRGFRQPAWDGAPLEGRRILLHAEQGLGDTLQFVRYAALVKECGGSVILECQASLERLLATAPGVDVITTPGAAAPEFDVHAPLLSLPAILDTRLETIPAAVPYLKPSPALVAHWRRLIEARREGRRLAVGLVWSGNPAHKNDRNRSLPAGHLAALAGVDGVRFFSLQKDRAPTAPPLDLASLAAEGEDFADTAAMIESLDLVISVDTSVAHLAGAMAKPVWVLLPFVPDWRWMLDREDSPWYPSMRLFRQTRARDWPGVLARVRAALLALKP